MAYSKINYNIIFKIYYYADISLLLYTPSENAINVKSRNVNESVDIKFSDQH